MDTKPNESRGSVPVGNSEIYKRGLEAVEVTVNSWKINQYSEAGKEAGRSNCHRCRSERRMGLRLMEQFASNLSMDLVVAGRCNTNALPQIDLVIGISKFLVTVTVDETML